MFIFWGLGKLVNIRVYIDSLVCLDYFGFETYFVSCWKVSN